MTKDIRLGGRGEELLGLIYRFGALTVAQYHLVAEGRDHEARMRGYSSRGNPWGRRISSRDAEVRRWVAEGATDEEIAARVGVDAESLRRFVAGRRLRAGEGAA